MVPNLKVIIKGLDPAQSPSDTGISIPPTHDFDNESILDHRKQAKAFIHILALCRLINKDIHKKFALLLKREGYIKED